MYVTAGFYLILDIVWLVPSNLSIEQLFYVQLFEIGCINFSGTRWSVVCFRERTDQNDTSCHWCREANCCRPIEMYVYESGTKHKITFMSKRIVWKPALSKDSIDSF